MRKIQQMRGSASPGSRHFRLATYVLPRQPVPVVARGLKLIRLGGAPHTFASHMAKTRPPYSPEFRRQMVELVRVGRDPDDLAREFEPTAQSIRHCVTVADRRDGRREGKVEAITPAERYELIRLRLENKHLRQERDVLFRAAACFANAVRGHYLTRITAGARRLARAIPNDPIRLRLTQLADELAAEIDRQARIIASSEGYCS
jgi:transposase